MMHVTLVDSSGSFWGQKVNSLLALTLLALMVFWVGLYYLGHKADTIGEGYIATDTSAAMDMQ